MSANVGEACLASRTRCSVLPAMRGIVRHAAPQSRDPKKVWTPDQQRTTIARRKTRVYALMVLRSVRGTHQEAHAYPYTPATLDLPGPLPLLGRGNKGEAPHAHLGSK